MQHKCKRCGKRDPQRFMPHIEKDLEHRKLCFTCAFWMDKILKRTDPNVVIVHGTHYYIGDERFGAGKWGRGHSGAEFVIKFNSGRKVTTTNLWCQGTIPGDFRHHLPDNAVFLHSEQGAIV